MGDLGVPLQTGYKCRGKADYSKGLFGCNLADEEPVDQKKYLEDRCQPQCVSVWLKYQACKKRIEGDESGHKHCTGQYFDYWSCVDKCVAKLLFRALK